MSSLRHEVPGYAKCIIPFLFLPRLPRPISLFCLIQLANLFLVRQT